MIFLHGHAGSMDPDVKYAPWFHERGISVLMFDFRGHGRSGGRRLRRAGGETRADGKHGGAVKVHGGVQSWKGRGL